MRTPSGGSEKPVSGTFGGVKRLGIAAIAAVAVLGSAPADAQDSVSMTTKTPQGRTVTLTVRDNGGERCLSITFADEGPHRSAPCLAPPKDAHDDARGLRAVYRSTPERVAILYGTVSSATAVLKVRMGDGRLEAIRPDRTYGAYLRVIGGRPPVATVNAHDASGALRGAADFDARAVQPARGPFALMRTRDERGGRATVTAFTARIYRERSTRRPLHACMGVVRRGAAPSQNLEPGFPGGWACTTSERRVLVRFSAGCGTRRLLLFGIVPAPVTRLRLITAAGARHDVPMARFPGKLRHPGRAFALSVPDPGPLSSLEAYARNGKRLVSLPLSEVGSRCASSSRS